MKIYRILIYISIILVLLSSCKKWLAINEDGTRIIEGNITPNKILPGVLLHSANASLNEQNSALLFQFLNPWMGYWTRPSDVSTTPFYSNLETYNMDNDYSSGLFTFKYQLISNCSFIEKKAGERGEFFYQAIGKVLKAWNYILLVDMFNNVPYKESLDPGKHYKPRYDEGQFIYEDCMEDLDKAISLIKGADIERNIDITTSDIMFHGDKNLWIQFINTFKLRLLVHQANKTDRSTYIQTQITKILAEGSGFLKTNQTASVNPGFINENDNKINVFYRLYGFRASGLVSSTENRYRANIVAMNFLKSDNDPRLELFYRPTNNIFNPANPQPFPQALPNTFRGNELGRPINQSIYPYQGKNFVSQIGGLSSGGPVTQFSKGILKGYNMDMWMLTSVESLFLQAEAIQRGWIAGNPKEAYMEAVKESFRWLNAGEDSDDLSLSDDVFSNWYESQSVIDNPNVSWDDALDKYKLLMYQKYIAFNGINPLESWTDYRRNGRFPNIPVSAHPGRTSPVLPIRWLYPTSELQNNSENVNMQGEINQFVSKIWWMP